MILINFIEVFLFYDNILKFFLIKVILLLKIFLVSFILFCLKILGGGDAKMIMIMFLIIYSPSLNFSIIYLFFFIFSIFFTQYHILKLIYVLINKQKFFFHILSQKGRKISILKQISFLTTFQLKNLSELEYLDYKKGKIRLNLIIFNFNVNKFQFFIHIRPPLILLISLSFITCLILLGFK